MATTKSPELDTSQHADFCRNGLDLDSDHGMQTRHLRLQVRCFAMNKTIRLTKIQRGDLFMISARSPTKEAQNLCRSQRSVSSFIHKSSLRGQYFDTSTLRMIKPFDFDEKESRSYVHKTRRSTLFGLNVLQFLWLVHEVVRISLGHESALVRFLDKILIALLLSKVDGILLGLEVEVCALHAISRRLPAH